MSWLSERSPIQKWAGLCLVLAKVVNIFAIVFVAVGFADKKFLWVAGGLTITGFTLLVTCLYLCGVSYYRDERADDAKGLVSCFLAQRSCNDR